jgi:hypothetical protein
VKEIINASGNIYAGALKIKNKNSKMKITVPKPA